MYNQVVDDDGNIVRETANDQIKQSKSTVSMYQQEYNEVIQEVSNICRSLVWNNNPANKDRMLRIEENEIEEICPRVWALSVELDFASQEDKEKCFLQTLLKGTFSLLGVKRPKCSLKISSCNIQIFFKIFDQVIKKYKAKPNQEKEQLAEISNEVDFVKVFGYLFETMRGLLIFAKEGDFDKLFIEENLVP